MECVNVIATILITLSMISGQTDEIIGRTRFYSLPVVSQRLVILNDSHRTGIYASTYGTDNINKKFPWATPAGLSYSPRSEWENKTGLIIPPGAKIKVFYDYIPVLNSSGYFQTAKRLSWTFPDHTIAVDVLTYKPNKTVFEIRTREKVNGQWVEGITYRPFDEPPPAAVKRTYSINIPEINQKPTTSIYEIPFNPFIELTPSKYTITAPNFTPKDYVGNMTSCNACHSQAGAQKGYGLTNLRGSDTIFSWHPFKMDTLNSDADPILRNDWPIEVQR